MCVNLKKKHRTCDDLNKFKNALTMKASRDKMQNQRIFDGICRFFKDLIKLRDD